MTTKGGASILGNSTFPRPVVFSCRDFFPMGENFQVVGAFFGIQFIERFDDI